MVSVVAGSGGAAGERDASRMAAMADPKLHATPEQLQRCSATPVRKKPMFHKTHFVSHTILLCGTSATGLLDLLVGDAGMFECLLLVHRIGATWVPVLAIPALIAGWVASIWLMLSGIKGIIAERGPKHTTDAPANPGRIVKWIGTRQQPQITSQH